MRISTIALLIGASVIFGSMVPVQPASAANPKVITIAGAGPQGRWFREVSVLGKVLTQHMNGIVVNGVTGKGVSIGNIKRIEAGQIQGGRFYGPDMYMAQHRKGPFSDHSYSKVDVWMKLGTHIFRVLASKDIKSYADLKGKKVAIGVKGSGDDAFGLSILGAYGITPHNTQLLFEGRKQAFAAFINHQIDALAYVTARNNRGYFGPVFAARPLGTDVEFVPPDAAKDAQYVKTHRGFFVDHKGEPAFGRPHLAGIALYQGLAVSADLSPKLVYRMTKVIFDNWKEITDSLPWWKAPGEASLASAAIFSTQGMRYHPGAIEYYKKKKVWPGGVK